MQLNAVVKRSGPNEQRDSRAEITIMEKSDQREIKGVKRAEERAKKQKSNNRTSCIVKAALSSKILGLQKYYFFLNKKANKKKLFSGVLKMRSLLLLNLYQKKIYIYIFIHIYFKNYIFRYNFIYFLILNNINFLCIIFVLKIVYNTMISKNVCAEKIAQFFKLTRPILDTIFFFFFEKL